MDEQLGFLPTISIITVVFNSETLIERTIQSIIQQTYSKIEFIIIDGASTDLTFDVIRSFQSRITRIISERDAGIYDAMNKGLSQSKGDYVLFINSGDELANPMIIADIFCLPVADIYYGDVLLTDADGKEIGLRRHRPPERLNWKSFRFGMLVSHQAFIVKRSIATSFNLRYKISADIDWCIRAMRSAAIIVNTHKVISKYLMGGASRKNTLLSWKERFKIMRNHYGLPDTLWCHVVIGVRFMYYYLRTRRLD